MVRSRFLHWYLQRVTGAMLFAFLVMHFWLVHYMAGPVREGQLSFDVIHARIANPWMQAINIGFLVTALYHGLSGVRNILLDYSRFSAHTVRLVTIGMLLLGVSWLYWGITAFVGNPALGS